MDWDYIEGNRDEFKAKQPGDALTDMQLEEIAGQRASLVGEIEEMFGISRHAAECQLSGWRQRLKP